MKMVTTARMSERGQIIIPKSIREAIGADANTLFNIAAIDSDMLVMKKSDNEAVIKEFENLRKATIKLSQKAIDKEIGVARNVKRSR